MSMRKRRLAVDRVYVGSARGGLKGADVERIAGADIDVMAGGKIDGMATPAITVVTTPRSLPRAGIAIADAPRGRGRVGGAR